MKLLTLNTHSLLEENYLQKADWFVDFIIRERPDVIALQEVNQTMEAPEVPEKELFGVVHFPVNDPSAGTLGSSEEIGSLAGSDPGAIPIRSDNHALLVARRLHEAGIPCSWVWLPIKVGYGKYDEGVAIFSFCGAIAEVDEHRISRSTSYEFWKTRKILGVRIEDREDWFYTVHMGWWNDAEDLFLWQWEVLEAHLAAKKAKVPVWLLGDFNSPAEVLGEGYDLLRKSGWKDTWTMAKETEGLFTVAGVIDGWRDKVAESVCGMRIDHIWCSRPVSVRRARVVFDGNHEPVVSDHFGVMLEYDR